MLQSFLIKSDSVAIYVIMCAVVLLPLCLHWGGTVFTSICPFVYWHDWIAWIFFKQLSWHLVGLWAMATGRTFQFWS